MRSGSARWRFVWMAGLAMALASLGACGRRNAASSGDAPSSSSDPAPALTLPARSGPAPEYAAVPATAGDDVLTYHDDLARTGVQSRETILTPASVSQASFGRLFSDRVDGFVYAQPLYVAGVQIPGKGRHNVVYVATENDSVYAFDADSPGPPLWQDTLADGGSPVMATEVGCGEILPRIGITSTPVIDLATGTLYVVALSERKGPHGTAQQQQLHALNIATGAEKFGGPVTIAGSVKGTGPGSVNGKVAFDASTQVSRLALALANGVLYIGFTSHCDLGNYHGWLFAYDARRLTPRAIFNPTPNGSQGSLWETGNAPAIDSEGNLYVITANGTFDAASGGSDYGDSFLKLALQGNTLRVLDFFTPFDQKQMNDADLDLGSGGAVLLPEQSGSHARLIVAGGKNGVMYLVDRDDMGRYQPGGNSQIVQQISSPIAPLFSSPAYWNGRLYVGPMNKPIQAFQLAGGRLSPAPVSESSNVFGYPGSTPSLSANGDSGGIVWALQDGAYQDGGPAILHAFDATNLADQLYTSADDISGESADPAVKFTTPIIAHGRVYFGTEDRLDVYGLLR